MCTTTGICWVCCFSMSLELLVSLKHSFPWCALWFLCWIKDLSQPILESLPSLQFLSTFLYTHGTSLTYCSCVCRLWNKGWLKALEFFLSLFCTLCLSFLGCKFLLVASAPSSYELSHLNFLVSFVVSWCQLGTYLSLLSKCFLLGHYFLFLPSLLQDILGGAHAFSPLSKLFFFLCGHHFLSPLCQTSFSILVEAFFLCNVETFFLCNVETFFLSPWRWSFIFFFSVVMHPRVCTLFPFCRIFLSLLFVAAYLGVAHTLSLLPNLPLSLSPVSPWCWNSLFPLYCNAFRGVHALSLLLNLSPPLAIVFSFFPWPSFFFSPWAKAIFFFLLSNLS